MFGKDDSKDAAETLKGLLQDGPQASDPNDVPIQKAKSKADDQDGKDDSYDEAYMKKNMKKFMKDNPSYMKKMGYMKKAIDDAYTALSEEDLEADATLVDGTAIFKAFTEFGNQMLKAFDDMNTRLENVEQGVGFGNEVIAASGEVLIKAKETLDSIAETPTPVKSAVTNADPMHKAAVVDTSKTQNDPNVVLQKAIEFGIPNSKKVLYKAAVENNDSEAGRILTQVESCHGNMKLLSRPALAKIASLMPVQA